MEPQAAGESEGQAGAAQVQAETVKENRSGEHGSHGAALKEWIGLLVKAAFWALLIYQFVFQVSEVRRESMRPNFDEGDRLLIDKLSYRFCAPRTGDVVVFEAVVKDREHPGGARVRRDFIKRVIAGPGDEVQVCGSMVLVNRQLLDEPWLPGNGNGSEVGEQPEGGTEYWVPPGHYFVLGDNRYNSEDSRGATLGFVAEQQIRGKVRFRFWPFSRIRWF